MKDFTAPWQQPVDRDTWKTFLTHTFEEPSREIAYQVINEFLDAARFDRSPKVAEVGFGQGYDFEKFFKPLAENKKISYTGFDITAQFVSYAKKEFPGYDFKVGGFTDLEPRSYQIVYTRHTFEHLAPEMIESNIKNFLEATTHLALISWFIAPREQERLEWNDRDGWGNTGAYTNRYGIDRIKKVIASSGFTIQMIPIDHDNEVYVLTRQA